MSPRPPLPAPFLGSPDSCAAPSDSSFPEHASSADRSADGSRSDVVRRLFEEHNRSLLGFLVHKLNSEAEAHDVAQEAYVRLLQLEEPSAVSFLKAYLFRIADNLAVDRLRHRRVLEDRFP